MEKTMDSLSMLSNLRHHTQPLSGGGFVLLLDTGAVITPEADAMLQALYSRSPASVHEHLRMIAEKGPEKFMSNFYVGYGHKSIGDCGSVTLFIEGVSMLAAKAIQDWMLYAGQEVSTRYVDFSTQPFINPINTEISSTLYQDLRSFYLSALSPLEDDLKLRYPRANEESETLYVKAIKARAFDILRGFLPAGASTSVAWHTNLRQGADKISLLRHHPLEEVRMVAHALEKVLIAGYPSSFSHKRYEATEAYNEMWSTKHYYLDDASCPDFQLTRDGIDYDELNKTDSWKEILSSRPEKTELPKIIGELGVMQFRFLLDFGSFRDIQRQRAVYQRMPLLSSIHGFEEWYLNELPLKLRDEATNILKKNLESISKLQENGARKELIQYYLPMGYQVPNRLTGDIAALVYLAELRATPFVHPTLQKRAHQIANVLTERLGTYGLHVYTADEVGRFDVRRGAHDITKKE